MSLTLCAPDEVAAATRLAARRKALGISAFHFAALAHFSPFEFSRIEHGRRAVSSAEAARLDAVLSTLEQAQASARERAASLLAS